MPILIHETWIEKIPSSWIPDDGEMHTARGLVVGYGLSDEGESLK